MSMVITAGDVNTLSSLIDLVSNLDKAKKAIAELKKATIDHEHALKANSEKAAKAAEDRVAADTVLAESKEHNLEAQQKLDIANKKEYSLSSLQAELQKWEANLKIREDSLSKDKATWDKHMSDSMSSATRILSDREDAVGNREKAVEIKETKVNAKLEQLNKVLGYVQ